MKKWIAVATVVALGLSSFAQACEEEILDAGGTKAAAELAQDLSDKGSDPNQDLTDEESDLSNFVQYEDGEPRTSKEKAKILNNYTDEDNRGRNATAGGIVAQQNVWTQLNVTEQQVDLARGNMGHASRHLSLRSFQGPEGPAMAPAGDMGWAAWGRGYGSWADQDERNDVEGFETDVYGLAVGMDKQFTENILVGVTLGVGDTEVDFDNDGGELDVDNYTAGIYGSYSTRSWFVDSMLGFSWHENESERNVIAGGAVSTSWADYDADSVYFNLGFGMNFMPGGNWIIVPSVRYQFSDYDQDSYSETGGGFNDLDVDGYDTDQHTSTLSLKVAKMIQLQTVTILPQVSVGWKHDFADPDKATMRYYKVPVARVMKTRGMDPADNAFLFSAGMDMYVKENVSAYMNYDLELKDDFDGHTLSTGLRIAF